MKKTFHILCLIVLLLPLTLMAKEKLDINNASADALQNLPVSENTILLLEEYLLYHGEFTSIYQVKDIKGISYEEFLALKQELAIFPKIDIDETSSKIEDRYYKLENMMNDEGASEGLVESWIDLFTNPRDVNGMHYFDLVNLPAVSPVDAAAVMKHIKDGNEIKTSRDLRGLDGISYYGYRNISDYVKYSSEGEDKLNGYATVTVKDFAAQITPDDGGSLLDQTVYDKYPLDQYYKFHLNYGQKYSLGLAYTQSLSESIPTFGDSLNIPRVKAYVSARDIDLGIFGKINKIIAGNYIASFGQGVVMETVDYFAPRKSGYGWRKRLIGINGDFAFACFYGDRDNLRFKSAVFNRHSCSSMRFSGKGILLFTTDLPFLSKVLSGDAHMAHSKGITKRRDD